VGPVPDPLLLRTCGSAGNQPRASGSVARNSDHRTTEEAKWSPANLTLTTGPQRRPSGLRLT
jgi:hypothetical protein